MKTKVRPEEAGSDAIKRYLKRKGYAYSKWQKCNAVRETWTKNDIPYFVQGMLYDMENETIEFELQRA